jgi:hypothetical protein
LLDRLRQVAHDHFGRPEPGERSADWARQFLLFHHLRHSSTLGAAESERFLPELAVNGHVAASTQNQAFGALLFLYQQVLGIELPRLDPLFARPPKRLPMASPPRRSASSSTPSRAARGCSAAARVIPLAILARGSRSRVEGSH